MPPKSKGSSSKKQTKAKPHAQPPKAGPATPHAQPPKAGPATSHAQPPKAAPATPHAQPSKAGPATPQAQPSTSAGAVSKDAPSKPKKPSSDAHTTVTSQRPPVQQSSPPKPLGREPSVAGISISKGKFHQIIRTPRNTSPSSSVGVTKTKRKKHKHHRRSKRRSSSPSYTYSPRYSTSPSSSKSTSPAKAQPSKLTPAPKTKEEKKRISFGYALEYDDLQADPLGGVKVTVIDEGPETTSSTKKVHIVDPQPAPTRPSESASATMLAKYPSATKTNRSQGFLQHICSTRVIIICVVAAIVAVIITVTVFVVNALT